METVIAKALIGYLAMSLIAFIIWCLIMYWILRKAIHHGIKDADLRSWWAQEPTMYKEREAPPLGYKWVLVRESDFRNTEPSPIR